jgi:hypothetical protein
MAMRWSHTAGKRHLRAHMDKTKRLDNSGDLAQR